ncbi:MAG: AcrR family transcriptional regulator [Myxococcota bacterium]|jgi:AcrR family transcriptional regulator
MAKHQPEEVRRRQILDAAKSCFIGKGLDATTMRDIAKEARLSLGGIYFHFGSKEEIFRAICNETYGTVLRRWKATPAEDFESTDARIRALAETNVELIETDPDYFRLALVLNGAAVVDEELKAVKREHHTSFVNFIAAALDHGVSTGELIEHDTRGIAESIVALFDGFYLRRAIDADISPRSSAIAALDLIMAGLKKG